MNKKWYNSKTLRVSVLTTLSGIIGAIETGGNPWAIALAVVSGVFGVLRVITDEGIEF